MSKKEFLLDAVSTVDEKGNVVFVEDLGENRLRAATLVKKKKSDCPKVIFVVKSGQNLLEYFNISQTKACVIMCEDSWLIISLPLTSKIIRLQLSSLEERKCMLETFHSANQFIGKEIPQIKLLVDFDWQKLRVLNIARNIMLSQESGSQNVQIENKNHLSSEILEFISNCLLRQNESSPNLMQTPLAKPSFLQSPSLVNYVSPTLLNNDEDLDENDEVSPFFYSQKLPELHKVTEYIVKDKFQFWNEE